jgi:hydroxymethylpyrimidine pyrophosphatase-like HAD family hydrolase
MIRLLSTDFDGTLVDHNSRPGVTPELFTALRDLREAGVKWAVNTGRTLWHAEEGLRNEFRFPIEPDFLLVEERDIYRRTRSGGWDPLGDWNARANRDTTELFTLAAPLLAEILRFQERFDGVQAIYDRGHFIGSVTKTLADMDELCGFLSQIRERLPLFNFQRNTIYVRFCHHAYSKGTALSELARHLHLAPDAIFAAGDHFNDLPMLDGIHARHVACPGNAHEDVKTLVQNAGGYIAKGTASLGIVEALRHFGAWPIKKG